MSKTPEMNAVVTQRIEVAPGLIILRVAPDGWELPAFEPGQFAVVGLPGSAPRCRLSEEEPEPAPSDKMVRRAYSIASASVAREYLEFYVSLVRTGALTPRLFALEAGDRVWLSRKFTGYFTLEKVPEDKHVVLVATGTGLAPYVSMLRSTLVCGGPRKYAVLLGAYHSSDLGYNSELVTLHRLCPNFTYMPIISHPQGEPVEWTGPTGYVQKLWQSDELEEAWGGRPSCEDTHVFLCGNPYMVEDMCKILGEEGFQETRDGKIGEMHLERYW